MAATRDNDHVNDKLLNDDENQRSTVHGVYNSTCYTHGCLGGAVVRLWTRDRKVAGSTPGRGTIKSTRSTQASIPQG